MTTPITLDIPKVYSHALYILHEIQYSHTACIYGQYNFAGTECACAKVRANKRFVHA